MAISTTDELEFFFYFFQFFEQVRVVLEVFRGTWWVANFFVASLCPGNCILTVKYFGYIKNGWARIFFDFLLFLEQIRVVLEVFRGTWRVANFFVASLCSGNCILTIKYFSYIKNGWARIFFRFFRKFGVNKGSFGGVPRYLESCQFCCR